MKKGIAIVLSVLMLLAAAGSVFAETQMTVFSNFTVGANSILPDAMDKILGEYNAENDRDVTFVHEALATEQYKTKLTTEMSSNAQPDVFFTYEAGFMKPFVEAGRIYPIGNDLMADEEWLARFPSLSPMEPTTFDGVIYAVPNTQQVCVLAYNKAVFEKAGVDALPATYAELLDACEKIQAIGVTPMAIPCDASWYAGQFLQQLIGGTGGYALFEGIVDGSIAWNDEQVVQAALEAQKMIPYLPASYLSQTAKEAFDAVLEGKIAMFFHITSSLSNFENKEAPEYNNIDFMLMPPVKAENAGVAVGSIGQAFAVSSKAKDIEACVELVKKFSEPDLAQALTDVGLVTITNNPVDRSAAGELTARTFGIYEQVSNYMPWFDRMLSGGEGTELNSVAVSIMAGDDAAVLLDELQQFALDNASR